jgi:hypothetical protein
MSTSPHSAGQFRVPSKDDYSIRSKHLSWLLGLPLQESQELLARIYRFPDLQALQQDLAQAKKNPAAYLTTLETRTILQHVDRCSMPCCSLHI